MTSRTTLDGLLALQVMTCAECDGSGFCYPVPDGGVFVCWTCTPHAVRLGRFLHRAVCRARSRHGLTTQPDLRQLPAFDLRGMPLRTIADLRRRAMDMELVEVAP